MGRRWAAPRPLRAWGQAHIVVRHSDTTTDRRMRQVRTVKFTDRDEPLDTVLSVSLMIRASNRQLRRGAMPRSVTRSSARYATRAMRADCARRMRSSQSLAR